MKVHGLTPIVRTLSLLFAYRIPFNRCKLPQLSSISFVFSCQFMMSKALKKADRKSWKRGNTYHNILTLSKKYTIFSMEFSSLTLSRRMDTIFGQWSTGWSCEVKQAHSCWISIHPHFQAFPFFPYPKSEEAQERSWYEHFHIAMLTSHLVNNPHVS